MPIKTKTLLLLGELDANGCPVSALAHFGREAYEHYMCAPYVRELLMVRKTNYVCWSPAFEQLYAAICVFGGADIQFEELGSTLFSTIDKFKKLDARYDGRLKVERIKYAGIEISQLLIDLAEALHSSEDITHYKTWQLLPISRTTVSRSYQSTSYAFSTTEELFNWISRARYGIHGIWWSLSGKTEIIRGAGNAITLFDPELFSRLLYQASFRVSVIKSELFDLGDTRFSASWVVVDNLSSVEAEAMHRIQEELNMPIPKEVCELSTKSLMNRPFIGRHADFVPIESGRPFDFSNSELLSNWLSFVA